MKFKDLKEYKNCSILLEDLKKVTKRPETMSEGQEVCIKILNLRDELEALKRVGQENMEEIILGLDFVDLNDLMELVKECQINIIRIVELIGRFQEYFGEVEDMDIGDRKFRSRYVRLQKSRK